MSCFIVSRETTAALADFISSACNMGYDYFGFDAPESLHDALSDCKEFYKYCDPEKVYFRLREMNFDAYVARYKEIDFDFAPDEYRENIMYKPREYAEGFHRVLPWHYDMLKKLDCYLYQCTEGEIYKTALYTALQEMKNILTGFIARNNAVYCECKWG